jgi:predicted AAA+ superfamily ATPase
LSKEAEMAYIERAITSVLKKRVTTSKCLLLTGARQVGKSTLVKHVFPEFHRANFDDRLTRLQAREEPKLFFMNNPRPLFIDEVQKENSILEEIKQIVDDSDQRGEFILSGSQKLELMKGVSESLAGRVSVMELTGLSLREIKGISFNHHFIPSEEYLREREKELRPYSNIWKIIHKGSYPELYDVDRDWQDYYSSYVATYLERDINELIAADSLTFTKFMTSVAARTGEMLNYANIAGEVGVSEPTIKNWISVLERTGIVYILQPYSSSALTRAIKTPKIYFRDTGLACYLTRWLSPETLMNSAVAGNMFETFVVSEILKSYSNEGRDYRFSIFYYRGKDKRSSGENEIDLVIQEDGKLYPVEIKMTGNPKTDMGAANQVLDKIPDKKRGTGVILCLIYKKTYLRENLIALPIEYI